MEKKYRIVTYGCQMNVHESEKLAGILQGRGYTEAQSEADADIVVFNTCCIRENAENHAYGNIGALKKLKKSKPEMLIAVGGCMTQQDGAAEKLKQKLPFVDIVFGTYNLDKFGELLDRRLAQKKSVISIQNSEGEICEEDFAYRTSYPNAWVNIMYGCNNFCTYCIVPYVRGRERSRDPEHILAEVNALLDRGFKEIVLLGQNVNSYGNDYGGKWNFPWLLHKICERKEKFRLRFMTSNPKDFGEELVRAIAEHPQICKLVHLPAQSGSDRVLKRMNRKYTAQEYLKKVELLRRYVPDCAVSSDLMVGFPGETEEDFMQTVDLVHRAKFSTAFTFVYSRRSGTVAADIPDQIAEDVAKDRIMRLVDEVNRQTRILSAEYMGKTTEILCEDFDAKRGLYLGRDEYGRMGYFASDRNRIGEFVDLRIQETSGISLRGEPIERDRY